MPTIKDTFVINIGPNGTLDRWGGHLLTSRCQNQTNQAKKPRIFSPAGLGGKIYPINSVKNEPVISGPYLMGKFLSTGT